MIAPKFIVMQSVPNKLDFSETHTFDIKKHFSDTKYAFFYAFVIVK